MDRNQLENAIYELSNLLKTDEVKEKEFQNYFEKYDVVFNVLGYSKAYPHLSLELTDRLKEKFDSDVLIPDFFAQKFNGNLDIFELKTPQESLIKYKRGRTPFYAKINDYIAQAIQYSEYFEDQENRNLFQKKYVLDIQKKVDTVIVAGRDEYLDKSHLHDEIRRRSNHLDIVTFDEILNRLTFFHTQQFGDTASYSSGAGYSLIMKLNNTSRDLRKYIFDVGDSVNRSRWSIFLNKNNAICSEIIDDEGETFSVKVNSPSKINTDKPFHLMCQFATNGQSTILQILINNQIVGESRFEGMLKIASDTLENLSNLKFANMGADINGNNANGGFDIYTNALTQPLNFLEMRVLAEAMYELKEATRWEKQTIRPGAYFKMW
jgi:Domain of unknown function (DUF4263)